MGKLKSWVRVFFGFSRTETNGFLILIPLMIVIIFSEPAYRWYRSRHPPDFSRDARALDSIMAGLHWNIPDSSNLTGKAPAAFRFSSFDPNHASEKEFSQMGLPDPIAKRIVRFREKGGVFRKKEDVLKIYGMDSTWYYQAEGWMKFPPKRQDKPIVASKGRITHEVTDINQADSLQLVNIYGIGPALSGRIRAYRERLGGFISMEQLHEVYGLDSSVVQKMKERFKVREGFIPRQVHLNSSTLEEMRQHPYIKWKEAQAILSYRLQHGKFTSLDQLAEINLLTRPWIDRVAAYLTLE